ncbi:serine/threonine-protein kinase [Nonomuraea pusilla]|uniref:serine/threonine-protein kinase n=1 Tax=Nonomuraea pusilla TaxID=46177 RepID=UPI001160CA4F|nr:serine/threonine-protein kinase [Nonomuraea pusilla]
MRADGTRSWDGAGGTGSWGGAGGTGSWGGAGGTGSWGGPGGPGGPGGVGGGDGSYVLAGRYRLVERLGEGGAGTVWRAADLMLSREVAVKQVRVPPGLTPHERAEFTQRAIHEARSAARLRDHAIVMVHDVVLDGDQPWIIMDLVAGRSLDKVIRESGPLPPAFVARAGLAVLSALEVAHAHGMLHQDVKPANILIDADGSAMLTDFGIAAPLGGQGDRSGTAGSPGYMAPERLNEQPSGPASDLWSLGASLYTAVEGRAPFERQLPAAVAAAVLLHEPPFPSRAGRELGRLIMAMLAKRPADRPGPAQVRQVLAAAAEGRAASRRRGWLLPAVLAAVVLLGAGGWYGVTALRGTGDTGRFASAPDPCALLTGADAGKIIGVAAPRRAPTKPGECEWATPAEQRRARKLIIRVWAERPAGGLGAPAVAQRRFASERSTRAGAQGSQLRETYSAVRDEQGIGEAAFVQDYFRLSLTSTESGLAESRVLLRTSNVLAEVVWRREDTPSKDAGDPGPALSGARLVATSLTR